MSKIRESANGMQCQIRIPHICNGDSATVVWCHANGSAASKGIGMKSHDLLGAYGCSACHDAYDNRSTNHIDRNLVKLYFWEGHARSLVLLIERGIIVVHRGKALVAA